MANQFTRSIFAIVILAITFSACKKNEATPQTTCILTGANNEQNKPVQTFTYDSQKRLSKFIFDEGEAQATFTYNTQNQVDKISLRLLGEDADELGDILPFTFTYDADGNVSKSVVTILGVLPVTINYAYTNKKLSSITSSYKDGTATVSTKTLIEYNGENISKASLQFEGKTVSEILITKYDTKNNVFPKEVRLIFLGLAGLDELQPLTAVSPNNAVSYKYLEDTETKIYDITENTWTYNSNNYPAKQVSIETIGTTRYTTTFNYLYSNCK